MQPTITENIALFVKTKNILFLLKAGARVYQHKRTIELIYSLYCFLFRPPSIVRNRGGDELKEIINAFVSAYLYKYLYTRGELIDLFADRYDVKSLPLDFVMTRTESVAEANGILIIGEYGDNSARVFYISENSCEVYDYYNRTKGVRHIHALYYCPDTESVFIATGDTLKLLDRWQIKDNRLVFDRRIKKRLAGFTAVTKATNNYFFGTDLSCRPNYIESLDGKKHFFPEKAYYKHCIAFYTVLERYIAAINTAMDEFGHRKTLSIFDAAKREFIYCDYLDNIVDPYVRASKNVTAVFTADAKQ